MIKTAQENISAIEPSKEVPATPERLKELDSPARLGSLYCSTGAFFHHLTTDKCVYGRDISRKISGSHQSINQ